MLIHAVAHTRGVFTLAIGAMLLAAPPAAVFAQDNTSAQAAPAPSPPAQSAQPPTGVQRPAPGGFLSEPHFLTTSIDYVTDKLGDGSDAQKSGFYPELSNMITGSGWLSAGPGYRQYFSDKRVLLDASAAVSWRFYKMAQGKFELPKLANGYVTTGVQAMWQDETQVSYFGIGPDSLEANRSQYRMQTTDVVGYTTVKPRDWLSIGADYGWLMRPQVMAPGGTFKRGFPDTQDAFPDDPGVALSSQPNFLHTEAAVTADTRDHPSYPSSGGLYRAASTAFFDQSGGTFSFRQYEAEAAQFIPLADKRWVLAFRGWTLYSDIPSGHQIPFYLLPGIGGNNTLRDFTDYRFHDNNLLNVNGESRWALYQHVDAAAFFDAGNVAARFGDLNLKKTSYGAGLRLHTDSVTFARADVAYGSEGWRFVFRTSEPFRLSRVKRHIAAVPFMP